MKPLSLLLCILITACSATPRIKIAQGLAAPSAFIQKEIPADPFIITTFEHIRETDKEATIYIEGDGLAWVSRRTPSLDPTPKTPLALELATKDTSSNVIYIARPCQYTKTLNQKPCPQKYWTSDRFSPEVIHAMNVTLNTLKARYGFTGFNLVGFSGGANVAALLTAQREDVLTLRTVAGNLDHERLHTIHNVTQLSNSLNAADIAPQIAHIPQHHFIGEKDNVVLPAIAKSFTQKSQNAQCIRTTIIPNATHQKGWASAWPSLLKYPINCENRSL